PACRENRKGHDPTQPTQPTQPTYPTYPTSYGATHIRTPSCTNPTCPPTGTPTSSSRPDLPSAGYRAPTWARKRERSDSGIAIPPTRIVVSTKRTAPGPVGAITTSASSGVFGSTSIMTGPKSAVVSGGRSDILPVTRIRAVSTATLIPLGSGIGTAPSRAAR